MSILIRFRKPFAVIGIAVVVVSAALVVTYSCCKRHSTSARESGPTALQPKPNVHTPGVAMYEYLRGWLASSRGWNIDSYDVVIVDMPPYDKLHVAFTMKSEAAAANTKLTTANASFYAHIPRDTIPAEALSGTDSSLRIR